MKPYTYILIHKNTNFKYYGCRYSKECHPNDFWKKYFTSSKKVKQLIEEYGKDSFVFEIRKTFDDPIKCRIWEIKVIRRMKIIKRMDFLNQRNPGGLDEFIKKNHKPWNFGLTADIDSRCISRLRGKTDRWCEDKKKHFSLLTKEYNDNTGEITKRMKENNPGKNTRHITNGIENKRVKIDELDYWLNSGYRIGRIDSRIYVNNGIIEKKIGPKDFDEISKRGFVRGPKPRNRNKENGRFVKISE